MFQCAISSNFVMLNPYVCFCSYFPCDQVTEYIHHVCAVVLLVSSYACIANVSLVLMVCLFDIEYLAILCLQFFWRLCVHSRFFCAPFVDWSTRCTQLLNNYVNYWNSLSWEANECYCAFWGNRPCCWIRTCWMLFYSLADIDIFLAVFPATSFISIHPLYPFSISVLYSLL